MDKKILLVDDETFFLEGLKEGLTDSQDVFSTDICFSVDEAIKLIKKNEYDLIISDIRMPKKSGLDLFVYLKKQKYHGGFIAMTAYGSEDILNRIQKLGGLDIILKPFNFDWFRDKILDFFAEDEGVSGTVSAIDLTSLLQMINLEKKTVAVKIEYRKKTGHFYFHKGEIIHAEWGGLSGQDAVIEMLKTGKGRFSVEQSRKKVEKTIDAPFMILLMNVMKETDEINKRSETSEEIIQIDLDNNSRKKKEEKMNVKKLNDSINVLKGDLGEGLLATDIFGMEDGQSLANWNGNPQACALFTEITKYMIKALDGAGFPSLGRYYLLDLVDDKMIIAITMGDYMWGMLLDRTKAPLGLLLNVVMPKIIDAFEEALAD